MTGVRLFEAIDWGSPWLVPLRSIAEPLIHAHNWRDALNAAAADLGLYNHRGLPIHFVPQASLPPDIAYEAFISQTGAVPTRDNLHDFFNALVWLHFPKTKVRLNALQAMALEELPRVAPTSPPRRGPLRDAATIFDENAALLVVRDLGLVEDLRAHRWTEVWIERREQFASDCDTWLFGHALIEKLVTPFKAITAHARVLVAEPAYFTSSMEDRRRWLDDAAVATLKGDLKTADFMPLPVLGIPGWWGGQDRGFYADTAVFRPKKRTSV
ncbi:DUF3025 domain-containing protein [Noviherbaspirillum saxi]|uniref:DUF3025 domain-containing protein n=1 Tax=Noviherbaspirillum saxi TaxID=2320863 RepID=A0A3A3GBP0_9BURK|nr:DUF3025 domain-containing protein [Noviherbaspirillum saxi]RJF99605.1 DUF3025 domain-containing protein [Noviherbaspirillum saxi]